MPELMEGITVLNQTPITEAHPIAFIIPSIVACIMVVVVAITLTVVDADPSWLTLIGISLLVWVLLFLLIGLGVQVETGEYIYEVTIDDSVSMNEFYSRYDVIDQRGNIYKIKIKN